MYDQPFQAGSSSAGDYMPPPNDQQLFRMLFGDFVDAAQRAAQIYNSLSTQEVEAIFSSEAHRLERLRKALEKMGF